MWIPGRCVKPYYEQQPTKNRPDWQPKEEKQPAEKIDGWDHLRDQMSNAKLQLLPGKETFSVAAEGLSALNPINWIKILVEGFVGAMEILFIILCLFCLVLKCGQKALWRALNETPTKSVILILQKTERGRCYHAAVQPSVSLRLPPNWPFWGHWS